MSTDGPRNASLSAANDHSAGTASVSARTGLARYLITRNRAWFVSLSLYAVVAALLVGSGAVHGDVVVTTGVFFILVMAIDLLYGCAGLLSFGHIGFFAIGAYTSAILGHFYQTSLLESVLAGILINGLIALGLGRVFLRLSGSYFMLGTLAFGIMVHAVLVTWYPVTGGDAGLGDLPTIQFGDLSPRTSLAIAIWLVAAALFWLTMNLSESRIGRALRAIRSDEVSAACCGVHVARLRINIFALSACYASVSGALFACYNGAVHPDSFGLSALLDVLLMLFFGGEGTIWGALIGVTLLRVLPDVSGPLQTGKILFSGVLFAIIIYLFPSGVAGTLRDWLRRRASRGVNLAAPAASTATAAATRAAAIASDTVTHSLRGQRVDAPTLRIEGVGQSFGGLRAVDDVSFNLRPASIRSLIGPNGAGKSTLLNLLSGVQPLKEGQILLGGAAIGHLRAETIARLGIARTFQHERLFAHLSIVANVMVGCERGSDGRARDILACAFALPGTLREEQTVRAQALLWLQRLALDREAEQPISVLPHGLRKLLEVARAVSAEPTILLLDETAAGLNATEKQQLKILLRQLQASGVSVLLIEHDMDFVMDISDEIVVINFGRRIAEGTPAQVREDPAVLAAYLGT